MPPKKILLIDDDDDIRELVSLVLELSGDYKVTSVSSGREGLIRAGAEPPDAILLDFMMPEMDGPTTLSHLRMCENTTRIPVIFITAKVRASELQTLLATRATGMITKPFDPMTLAAQVTKLLGEAPR